jgi:hypothetical protein
MLGITEEQYQLDYEYKAFVKTKKPFDASLKEAFDASLNIVKEESKELLYLYM